jgi:hypothetical protein
VNAFIGHLELQAITALSLISTFYKSQQHALSIFQPAVFTGRSLATASNSGDSSASRAQVHLCHSRQCNTLVNCQLNYGAISSQPPLQSSTEMPTPNSLDFPRCLLYNFSVQTTSKRPFLYCCVRLHLRGNVFTEPLLRNGCLFTRLLHSNGCTCLFRGPCLATGLHAIIQYKMLKLALIEAVEAPTFFLDNRLTDGGEILRLTRRPPFTPTKNIPIPGTHFS